MGSWRHDRGGTFLRTTHVSTGTRRCVGTRAPLRYDTDRHATYGWLPGTRRPFGETCAAHALTRAYGSSTCVRWPISPLRRECAALRRAQTAGTSRTDTVRLPCRVRGALRQKTSVLLAPVEARPGTLSGPITRNGLSGRAKCLGMPASSNWRYCPRRLVPPASAQQDLFSPGVKPSTRPVRPGSLLASGSDPFTRGCPGPLRGTVDLGEVWRDYGPGPHQCGEDGRPVSGGLCRGGQSCVVPGVGAGGHNGGVPVWHPWVPQR